MVLKSSVVKKSTFSKPKERVHHITLSSVVVKKPMPKPILPKPEPIILPPDPKPVVKPKSKPKPKPKKIVKKQITASKPIVPVVKEIIPVPVIEQTNITPIATIDRTTLRDKYANKIREAIRKNLFYPKMAKRLRIQGVVKVTFVVQKNGNITDIRILNSPKNLLKKGAIKTIESTFLEPIPKELDKNSIDIVMPIEFKLIGG